MHKSISISVFFLFFCSIVFAQSNINSYKYIIVPKQFEFQKSEDQHQLNSLIKFLFNKAEYTVLFTDEKYPEDLANNVCLGLKVNVNNSPTVFKTIMNIDLLDCYNRVVYSTTPAKSKEKEYKKAYYAAIRKTFVDLEELNYEYDSTLNKDNKTEIKETVVTISEVKAPLIKSMEAKEVTVEPILKEITPIAEAKVIELKEVEDVKIAPLKNVEKSSVKSIEGKFNFENWGISTVSKNGDDYSVIGGDENFEFATIYKTSKPTIFIIKWVAYKQPQLLEINNDGDLEIDSQEGVQMYKRVK